jgi:hypothetical protein
MKKIIYFVILLNLSTASAQFAIVDDPNGFCHLYDSLDKNSKKLLTLKNGEIVFNPFEPQDGWRPVDYRKEGKFESGYIYGESLKYIYSFLQIPRYELTDNKVVFKSGNIQIEITQKNFDPKGRKYFYPAIKSDYIEKIDGYQTWGTDGRVPTSEYNSVEVIIKDERITLPKTALGGMFEPNLKTTEVYYDAITEVLYIEATNGDAAGAYSVLWIIEKGVYKERHIALPF